MLKFSRPTIFALYEGSVTIDPRPLKGIFFLEFQHDAVKIFVPSIKFKIFELSSNNTEILVGTEF